jgi:hypothetical protein
MKIKELLPYYLRSKTNIVVTLLFAAAVITSALLLEGVLRIFIPAGCLLLYFMASGLIIFSRRGAREIVSVRDDDYNHKIIKTIDKYSEVRERISFLRLGDEEVKKAVEYFLLISGTYLEKCNELKTYSPAANNAIEEAETVLNLYLGELDEASSEKRYEIADKDDFKDYKEKTLGELKALAQTVKQRIKEDLVGLSRRDQFKIMEEL